MTLASPVPVLVALTVVLVFEGLLFGATLVESSFPEFEQPDGILDALIGIVQAIWGVVVFIFNLITFNIPGAPFWVRVPVGIAIGGSLMWSIATLIRGGAS